MVDKVNIDEISGAFMLSRPTFADARGEFSELSRTDWDLPEFKQTNIVKSNAMVARGLHYQAEVPQGKLVTCVSGSIIDFVLDLRPSSPTRGTLYHVRLRPNGHSIYVPEGCAHGYVTMEPAVVHYACTELYVGAWNSGYNMADLMRRNNIPYMLALQFSKQDEGWPKYDQNE
jgi:dTDP-4-dehydrorhamnose 3,5-epimerase